MPIGGSVYEIYIPRKKPVRTTVNSNENQRVNLLPKPPEQQKVSIESKKITQPKEPTRRSVEG